VLEDLDRTLTAVLARTLEFDPALSHADAAKRVALLAEEAGMKGMEERLIDLASRFHRRAVINPRWLREDNIRPYFFLANGRPGLLGQVIRDTQRQREGISQYVLYGHWDSLLALYGSADEASSLMKGLQDGAYEDSIMFAAQDVLLSYRHKMPAAFEPVPSASAEDINKLALDYDDQASRKLRETLLQANVIVGSALTLDGNASPYPITAFVGITVRARAHVTRGEVLDTLLAQDALRTCMRDLYLVEQGMPYHYFATLACASVKELDAATNAVAFASHGAVRFEGETLVVAHGSEQLPLVRKPDVASLLVVPDVGPIVRAAQRVFDRLGRDEQTTFNNLREDRQLATLRALSGLQETLDGTEVDLETRERIESGLSTFVREAAKSAGSPNLTGPVMEITAMVETTARRFLSRLTYSVYGNNPATIQSELKLPTRKIRDLSLGKVTQALRIAVPLQRFEDVRGLIADDWIDRLDAFSDVRNTWAHGAADHSDSQVIDQAFWTMREGIEIAGWLADGLAKVRDRQDAKADADEEEPDIKLPTRPDRSDFSVFVSHATSDNAIAERLAKGMQAVGYRSWYSGWDLAAGDSIVGKIGQALSTPDVLIVLLSKESVASHWVMSELNAALMQQLSGSDVLVIPIQLEECPIPALLQDILRIDLREGFEPGFLKLLEALRRHKNRAGRDPDDPV
jgi:TIR domain